MRIGLVLDNPKRDLTGLCLIAYHLLQQRHDVFIIPMYDQGSDMPFLQLDAIVVNYARTSNVDLLKTYKQLGMTIFVLDTEGGLMPDFGQGSPEFWAERVREIGAPSFIDHYIFWGTRHYQAYRKHSGIEEKRLHVAGSPRHDICHPKWRPTLQHSRSGFILVNLNFPLINPWWGTAHVSVDQNSIVCGSARQEMSNTAKVIPVDVEKAHRFQDELLFTLNELLRTMRSLAFANPDRTFVVRPHPFENQEVYKAFFAPNANVVVDGSGEVMSVIKAADLVLHLNCGTSVETRLLGKAPVSLEFLNSEVVKYNVSVPSNISYPVKGIEELDALVKDPDAIPAPYKEMGPYCQELKPWFGELDGKAAERAASIIAHHVVLHPRITSIAFGLRGLSSCQAHPKVRHLILGAAALLFGSRRVAAFRNTLRPQRAMKYTDASSIQEKIQGFAQCDGGLLASSVNFAHHALTGFEMSTIHLAPLEPIGAKSS
ncbi:MAG: surface carbohydrate biosynthesis protein [Nitrospira sp.]